MLIKELLVINKKYNNSQIEVKGWVDNNRDFKDKGFIDLNDGSSIENIQIFYQKENIENFETVKNLKKGSAIKIKGILIFNKDKNNKDFIEIKASQIEIYNFSQENYPIQKQSHSFEFLRSIAHLRVRTKTFHSVFTIRNTISYSIHKFFKENDFFYFNSPIITSNDAEGAGEVFNVTTLDKNKKYSDNFFLKRASLTVSGQLTAEAYAQALGRVYTFGPTFRAENSKTTRHIAEFWMIEPEFVFSTLQDNMELAEKMIKYIIKYVLDNNASEINFLNKKYPEQNLINKLKAILDVSFAVITYDEAIIALEKALELGYNFENKIINWGMDLQTEHERYLCEELTKKPTFVINYPKDLKAFYMKINSDNRTVQAMDLLVPKIGELIGGSQREDNYDFLLSRMKEKNIDTTDFEWYLNLRKYGYAPSGGFGLGLERLVMYITGMENIRDVIPFPRYPNSLSF